MLLLKKNEYNLYLISKIITLILFYSYLSIHFTFFESANENFHTEHMLAMRAYINFFLCIIVTIYNTIDYGLPHSSLNSTGLSHLKIFNGFTGIFFSTSAFIKLISYMSLGLTFRKISAFFIIIFLLILNVFLILSNKQIFIFKFKKILYFVQFVIIMLGSLYLLLFIFTWT